MDSTDVDEPANATLDDGHENPWLESDEVRESLGEDCRLVDYDGWHLWKADVSTTESTTLEAKELDLASNTVVTGIRIEYGAVAADFTTRSDADSWTRDDLKDEHDDLEMPKQSLAQTLGAQSCTCRQRRLIRPKPYSPTARASIFAATAAAINLSHMTRTVSFNAVPYRRTYRQQDQFPSPLASPRS